MTIYEIKRRTQESSPYFFSRETLRFFGQTLKSFRIRKESDGRYRISAPMHDFNGSYMGMSVWHFDPFTNDLRPEVRQ